MHNPLFAAALGLPEPWYVKDLSFDEAEKRLTIQVDFRRGSRFAHGEGTHPVHDTQLKRYRHLNFFQHECVLEARVPRVRLPDGSVALVKPPWAGRSSGFSLLFEALVMSLCREMPFAAVARLTGLSWHRAVAICTRYVELAVAADDLSGLRAVAIDETSRAKGHDYVTLVADAKARRVVFVDEGRGADTVQRFAADLAGRGGDPERIESASIDMSRAYIKGVAEHLPHAEITFDKFHVIAQASQALDRTRRIEQRHEPELKGLRWALLKKPENLTDAQLDRLTGLLAGTPGKRTTRAWIQLQQLSDILQRKQINVVKRLLHQWRQRQPLQGPTHEGRRQNDPQTPPRHRRLGTLPTDQRLPRSPQRPRPGRQAQSPRLPLLPDHAHRHLPRRRQTRLPGHQPPHRLTHSKFKRATSHD